MNSKISKYLILLDINESLLYRTNTSVKGKKHDRKLYGRYLYIRPGAHEFLEFLLSNPKISFAFYSSITIRNIIATEEVLFEKPPLRQLHPKIFTRFDRSMNAKDPEPVDEWDTIRDLNKIWASKECKEEREQRGVDFNNTNTLLLESTLKKAQNCLDNTFMMVPYTEEDVKYKTMDHKEFFQQCIKYIDKMVTEGRNVQEFLRNQRFNSIDNVDEKRVEEEVKIKEVKFEGGIKQDKKSEATIKEDNKVGEKSMVDKEYKKVGDEDKTEVEKKEKTEDKIKEQEDKLNMKELKDELEKIKD